MFIKYGNLTIRNAGIADAEQLCTWWNDGTVMAHAGLPNGVGCTPEEVRESLAGDTDDTHRRHIIALDGKPIGEMNYRNKGEAAELGIKICDFTKQEKGYGTILLTVFIDALFRYYGYEAMILDTNLNNARAQHVYEKKLGFRCTGNEKDSWRNQLGELQSTVNFRINKAEWFAAHKEPLEYIHGSHTILMNHWYANIYDQFETHDHDINSILSMVGTVPKNILEVACGTGRISIPLAKAGHNVTGFDMDEFMLKRIPAKAEGLSNFTWRQANALTDDWGGGFDVVVLSGNILVNIVADGDYSEAQELFIQKAAKSLVPGGHLYLNFDCVNWPDMTATESQKRVVFEGTDDWGTYGRYLGGGGGSYDSKTRIDISDRDYEITPQNGDPFTVTRTWLKHFPTHGEVAGWLEKHGFTIEWENPVREETYHAIIWARKIKDSQIHLKQVHRFRYGGLRPPSAKR